MVEFYIHYFKTSSNTLHSSQVVVVPKDQIIGAKYDDILDILNEKRKYQSMDCVYELKNSQNGFVTFPMTIRRVRKEDNRTDIFG